eukprot:Seg6905.2 transcript_id=Seg6905.2/GoldUCD/mRNA.D3Y31 product="5-hydroxytryptamine receptor 2C" protein_id=Seg6905.2/GoldUCD/D3Y31
MLKMPAADQCGAFHDWIALSFASAAYSILLILLTVPLNIAVIVAIIKSKTYKSNFYIIMLNTAISDLLCGIVVQPFAAVLLMEEGMKVKEPPAAVKAFFVTVMMLGSSSVLSMALLNFDRYISIQWRNSYEKLRKSHVIVALIIVWIISGFCGYLKLIIGFSSFVLVFSLVTVLFTVAVMSITIRTFWKKLVKVCDRHTLQEHRLSIDSCSQQCTVDTTTKKVFSIGRFRASRSERRIIRTLFLMFVIFILSYFPIFLACIYLNTCKDCNCLVVHILRDVVILAILTSSVARPVNFLLRLTDLRKGLRC